MSPSLKKALLPLILLMLTIVASYGTIRQKDHGINVLKKISFPPTAGAWIGSDVKQKLNLGQGQLAYIGEYQMKKYVNQETGAVVFVTIMSVGNFHHPKLCFSGSGYVPEDLPDTS